MPHVYTDGSPEWFREYLKDHEGFWEWDGHKNLALLTSGMVSDVYVNLTNFCMRSDLVTLVVEEFMQVHGGPHRLQHVTHVIGPAFGGLDIAADVVRYLRRMQYRPLRVFAEPMSHGTSKTLVLSRFDLPRDAHILLVDDVISTGSSLRAIAKEIHLQCPSATYHPTALCLADRVKGVVDLGVPGGHKVTTCGYIKVDGNVWNMEDVPDRLKECGHMRPKPCWNALNTQMLEVKR